MNGGWLLMHVAELLRAPLAQGQGMPDGKNVQIDLDDDPPMNKISLLP